MVSFSEIPLVDRCGHLFLGGGNLEREESLQEGRRGTTVVEANFRQERTSGVSTTEPGEGGEKGAMCPGLRRGWGCVDGIQKVEGEGFTASAGDGQP
jgi:hypothetical protein